MRSKAFLPDRSYFNPRSPQGGATTDTAYFHDYIYGFQSTLPARGSDLYRNRRGRRGRNFNPRSPQGGATLYSGLSPCISTFQSTLPARGSDTHGTFILDLRYISIHAPRKGERRHCHRPQQIRQIISIHAPRKGERQYVPTTQAAELLFQSTLPARGSDAPWRPVPRALNDFNPRSPQGGATSSV